MQQPVNRTCIVLRLERRVDGAETRKQRRARNGGDSGDAERNRGKPLPPEGAGQQRHGEEDQENGEMDAKMRE